MKRREQGFSLISILMSGVLLILLSYGGLQLAKQMSKQGAQTRSVAARSELDLSLSTLLRNEGVCKKSLGILAWPGTTPITIYGDPGGASIFAAQGTRRENIEVQSVTATTVLSSGDLYVATVTVTTKPIITTGDPNSYQNLTKTSQYILNVVRNRTDDSVLHCTEQSTGQILLVKERSITVTGPAGAAKVSLCSNAGVPNCGGDVVVESNLESACTRGGGQADCVVYSGFTYNASTTFKAVGNRVRLSLDTQWGVQGSNEWGSAEVVLYPGTVAPATNVPPNIGSQTHIGYTDLVSFFANAIRIESAPNAWTAHLNIGGNTVSSRLIPVTTGADYVFKLVLRAYRSADYTLPPPAGLPNPSELVVSLTSPRITVQEYLEN